MDRSCPAQGAGLGACKNMPPSNPSRTTNTKPKKKTKEDKAKPELRRLLEQALDHIEDDEPSEPVAEALERWLADVKRRTKLHPNNPERLQIRTLVLYRRAAAVLAAEVGDVPLDELDVEQILEALDRVSEGSRHNIGTSWQAGLSWLERADAMPHRSHYARTPSPGTWDEDDYHAAFEALVEAAEGRNRTSRSTALAAMLCAACGLRVGEAVPLTRSDVIRRKRGWWLRVTGKTGERLVPLSTLARGIIKRCPKEGYLFPSRSDSKHPHIIADSVSSAVRRVCDRAGLPHVHTHWLRHGYASWLAGYGVPLPVVSRLLGHSSVGTTYAYYFSGSEAQMLQATELVSEALARGQMSLPMGPSLPSHFARVKAPKAARRKRRRSA